MVNVDDVPPALRAHRLLVGSGTAGHVLASQAHEVVGQARLEHLANRYAGPDRVVGRHECVVLAAVAADPARTGRENKEGDENAWARQREATHRKRTYTR